MQEHYRLRMDLGLNNEQRAALWAAYDGFRYHVLARSHHDADPYGFEARTAADRMRRLIAAFGERKC